MDLFACLMPVETTGEINTLGDFWTVRVTSYMSLSDACAALTKERILKKAKPDARLAVCCRMCAGA